MAQKKGSEKKMPPKKGASPKKANRKPKNGQGILIKLAIAVVLALAAAGAVAYLANRYAPKLEEARKPAPPKAVAQAPRPRPAPPPLPAPALQPAPTPEPEPAPQVARPVKEPVIKPVFEIFPDEKHGEETYGQEIEEPLPPLHPEDKRPRVAIIIDDMGYSNGIQHKFLDIPYVLTYSVLPHSPDQVKIANLAHVKGREVMLHLPMEPLEYPKVDSGPGTLLASMSTDALMDTLSRNLAVVPHAVGVNNHMGSRLTSESGALYPIFTVLKKRHLFFVDSRTTQHSVCRPSARLFQLPFAQRDVFLDHERTTGFVEKQLDLLVRIAQKRGQAIGIGHPYTVTYEVLAARLPEVSKKVRLVSASELVRVIR